MNETTDVTKSTDVTKTTGSSTRFEQLAADFKLLSDKTRLTILAMLKEQEMCVCDIVSILETTQPNASQHLKKLKNGGLLNETKRKQWVYYSLAIDDKPYLAAILAHLPSMKDRIQSACSPGDCCD